MSETSFPDRHGLTELHYAARAGDAEEVRRLLAAGANLSAVESLGGNALHYAASFGKFDVVRVLIEAGADISRPDNNGETPADDARTWGHRKLAKFLERTAIRQRYAAKNRNQ